MSGSNLKNDSIPCDFSINVSCDAEKLRYSETLNNEYIGRIYQMSSWVSMSFILYYVNFSSCENK